MAFATQTLVFSLLCTAAIATRHLGQHDSGLDADAPGQLVARRHLLDSPPGALTGSPASTTPINDTNAAAPSVPLFKLPTLTFPSAPTATSTPSTGTGSVTIINPSGSVPAPKSGMPNPTPKPTPTDKGSAPAAAKGINTSKAYPNGTTCSIFTTSVPACSIDQPIPACCTSSKSSAQCVSYDNGDSVECPDSIPFPACCEARPQPLSVCVRPSSTGFCFAEMPIPACCNSSAAQCLVFSDGSDVSCDPGYFAGCCPA